MSNLINSYYPNILPEEQKIYQHLLHLVQIKSPHEMIEHFRALFIEGINYPEPEIIAVLDQITASATATQEFKFFLNRCCHILINRWHMQPQLQHAIPELIRLFESPPSRYKITSFREKAIRRLQVLIKQFIDSEQYTTLRRLTQIIAQNDSAQHEQKQLFTLMRRYPYLYEHCLLTENSTFEHQWTVKKIKAEVQKKFEIDLSRYVTYQVRCHHFNQSDFTTTHKSRTIQPVINPTLLSETKLNAAIKQFIGKVEGGYSYQEYAQLFLNYSTQVSCYGAFKDDLYEYLISGIDLDYGKRKFQQHLYRKLQNTLADADEYKLDEFLLVRTCCHLLNFLVVENQISPQHFTFIDLIANQGTLTTTSLLLKIVLICRKVKPYLAKRFAILFNHYESVTTNGIMWLVETLEHLNIAYSIHFGNTDLSYFKQMF
ncbi:hypothetical protein NIES4101_77160 [Calothrix sp. NIES-4101]|nr:hypothetical protein NIES4101_77160 [Calothrix sp. NIES-4101]